MPSPRPWCDEPTTETVQLIEGALRDYDWGSTTSIPDLLGRPATGRPVAEAWFGAHPSAPALVGGDRVPLDRLIAADPVATLGAEVGRRFGSLPFLLKVLAAAEPLSLQAHPSARQAEAGFAREEAAGVPIDSPTRSFRDPRPKPELICALTEFDALCGFRDPAVTLEVLASVGAPALDTVGAMLREDPSPAGLRRLLGWLLTLDEADAAALSEPVIAACEADSPGPFAAERRMAGVLGRRYPGDAGVVTALLLNLVTLHPGDALFLGAGNIHAYLRGTGVEVMANSDNVLRGGLTSKHVDVPALLDVVDPVPVEPRIQRPPVVDGVAGYSAPVPEFALERIEVRGRQILGPGPAIVLCTSGRAECGRHLLDRGAAAWIPAVDEPAELVGHATIFRASPGAAR